MKLSTIIALGLLLLVGCHSEAGVLVNGVYVITNPPAEVTLAWNKETDPTVVGYNLYEGTSSRTYTNLVNVGNQTNINVTIQRGVTYYFAVTAYNAAGLESEFSTEVSYDDTNSLPIAPTMKPPVTLFAQQKIGTGNWQSLYALSIDPSVAPMSEFRLLMSYSAPPPPAGATIVPMFKPASPPTLPTPQVLPTSKGKMTIWRATI